MAASVPRGAAEATGGGAGGNGSPFSAATKGTPWEYLDARTLDFYLRAMETMDRSQIPYAIGGAYSLAHYCGIVRHTKDLDLFILEKDLTHAMGLFAQAGYQTVRTHPHWLAKAYAGLEPRQEDDAFVDLIYSSGNGLCPVDREMLDHAVDGQVLGRPARLCPVEEIIWSKAFVQERNRFDGADIAHLLVARGAGLDWRRLVRRFAGHEPVLLGHLVFFRYIFPSEPQAVPDGVLEELFAATRDRRPPGGEKVCGGTCVSWEQYLIDIEHRGYTDGRLPPHGALSAEQIKRWTRTPK